MNDFSGSPRLAFDAQTIHWEDHPVFRAVGAGNLKTLQKMVDLDVVPPKFGRERSNFIRNELGVTPLMLALTKSRVLPRDTVQKIVTLLLERFKMDPNAADYHGRTAIFYAILHNVDVSVLGTLLNRGADVKALDHNQLSPLMYAAALNRKDIVRFVCPDYRAQITATLKIKFSGFESALRHESLLEVPFRTEGSPKRYVPYLDSPLAGSPINGIRFRLSPSSPSTTSNATSPLSVATTANYPREPNVSRRTSVDKTGSSSKSTTVDFFGYVNVMRRVSSAVFDSRLYSEKSGALQFAQLTQNLCVYLEDVDNLMLDKSPEPRDSLHADHQAALRAAEEGDVLASMEEEEDERLKEPRRVSLPVSAPILIKSRSVEESINREHNSADISFRALPRDLRKNALASGHLIERQGSAPQLMLKRKPRGAGGGGSADSSGAASPTGTLSRNATRQQILSPLVHSALANYQQK